MRPMLIVIDSPGFNLLSRIVQGDKHLRVQTLVAKSAVETLNHRMLHGFAGPHEIQLDVMRVSPCVERVRGKPADVVDGNHFGIATVLGSPLQSRDHLGPRQREIHLNEWTVPTPVIDDGEGSNAPSIEQGVGHNTHTPPLIDSVRQWGHHSEMTRPFSPVCEPHGQPFIPINPMHPLFVDHPAFAPEQPRQPGIAKAWAGLRQLQHPLSNGCIVALMRSIQPDRSIAPHEPARGSLTDRERAHQESYPFPLACRLDRFVVSTSWSITFSSVRSATSCLNFRFPSSSSRKRRISAIAIWPYVFRHR